MKIIKKLQDGPTANFLCFLCFLFQPFFIHGQSTENVGFYIENFGGKVDPETLPHVYEVFAKVRAIAGVNNRGLPQLAVIKELQEPLPLAFVLPDSSLVLSQRALDIIYKDVSLSEGNTRLAFVLGHELAHLANDDIWSAEVEKLIQSRAFSGKVDGDDLKLEDSIKQDKKDLMERELKADDKGFLYAAMAGFPVEQLLAHENDFLSFWVAETHTQSSITHPEAIQRTNLLNERLQEKKRALEFFYMGVRLSHFGRHQDAVYFFREFQKVFPGCEVFNNLGVSYLQLAVNKMLPAMAYQYWLPGILDDETLIKRTDILPIFRDRTQTKIVREFLEQAVRYLKIATEKCPAYRIGYINLAVAYFYLDEVYKARAAIEDARNLKPDDPEVESLRALILFEEGQPMEVWPYAEEIFSNLAEGDLEDTLPLSVYYNWARLLEARGRSAESQWRKLEEHRNDLPGSIAQMLCERLKDPPAIEKCLKEKKKAFANKKTSFHGPLPIQPGVVTWLTKKENHPLKNWEKRSFNWQGSTINSGVIYESPKGESVVLEMDDVVEMVVLKQIPEPLEKLLQEYGQPGHKKPVLNGELWVYGHWTALVNQDKIQEIWVVTGSL